MRKLLVLSVLGAMILTLANCKSTKSAVSEKPKEEKLVPYAPTEANALAHKYDLNDLKKGREIFVASCQQCHRLFPVDKHDYDGWAQTLERMAPKAHLDPNQKDQVLKYLSSWSAN
ncbi:MAG: cytochrome c [Chitinophagales bacterium]